MIPWQQGTQDGRAFRILTILNEYTGEYLKLTVARRIKTQEVIHQSAELFIGRRITGHIRSDNKPEFKAKAIRQWLQGFEVKTLYIEPGSPWEKGYIESFNSKLRDELVNAEIFTTLFEA